MCFADDANGNGGSERWESDRMCATACGCHQSGPASDFTKPSYTAHHIAHTAYRIRRTTRQAPRDTFLWILLRGLVAWCYFGSLRRAAAACHSARVTSRAARGVVSDGTRYRYRTEAVRFAWRVACSAAAGTGTIQCLRTNAAEAAAHATSVRAQITSHRAAVRERHFARVRHRGRVRYTASSSSGYANVRTAP